VKNLRVMAAVAACGLASSAFAQTNTNDPAGYHFEFRIIADGDIGAPIGPGTIMPLTPIATQIGFWVQARVVQTTNENWGITRVSPPAAPETSFLNVTDSVGSTINRGSTNATDTNFGRGTGYRNGGPSNASLANTPSGNDPGSVAFPGITNNQNGAIDSGSTRIYSFDAYVGSTRNPVSSDDPTNPWRVNGAANGGNPAAGAPVPSDGVTYSPWASVYRFTVLPTNVNSPRAITLTAFAMVQGAIGVHPTDASLSSYAMEVGPGRSMTATYTFTWGIPTPGAAALMGMGMIAAGRRRR
jgi:hypothetical protein